MIRYSLAAASAALFLAGCATEAPTTAPVEPPPVAQLSPYVLGMDTAASLERAGNVPAAIQRLMQLLGETDLDAAQRAGALDRIARLSMGPGGYDADGALAYFDELLELLADNPGTFDPAAATAGRLEALRRIGELEAVLASEEAGNSEKFAAFFALGRHPEAIDLMVSFGIEPDNEVLLAMYQTGYLCDEAGLTGQAYSVTDRDGTARLVRFCDLGK